EVAADIGCAPRLLVAGKLVADAALAERRRHMLGSQHPGQDRVVRALDARQVDEAGCAADQRPTRKSKLRHRLPASLRDGARPIGDALAALESRPDQRVLLEALKLLERRNVGIAIIQMHHETDDDLPVLEVIEKRAAAGLVAERPAEAVLHQPGAMLFRRD